VLLILTVNYFFFLASFGFINDFFRGTASHDKSNWQQTHGYSEGIEWQAHREHEYSGVKANSLLLLVEVFFLRPIPDIVLVEIPRYNFKSENKHHYFLEHTQVTWSKYIHQRKVQDYLKAINHMHQLSQSSR
jgi:hypothetical protein